MGIHEWRSASFSGYWGSRLPEPPAVDRWEALLRAERTVMFRLLSAASRRRRLRRLLGIRQVCANPGVSLADREERVDALRTSRFGGSLRKKLGTPLRRERQAGLGLPAVGPLLDQDIDRSLGLLANMAFEELQQRGWHLQPNHYYWPLNDMAFLRANPQLWMEPRLPAGIDWDIDRQAGLIQRLARYSTELADVRWGPRVQAGEFIWGEAFGGLDAYAYYGLLRELRPSRVIEVGIGRSTLLLQRALAANGTDCEVVLIDPAPRWELLGEVPKDWTVVPNLVQHTDLDVFQRLQPGDVLFYDGSHCVRTGSDVNWMFFEVLPTISAGVWIHVHDLSWPRDYGDGWVLDEGLSWNEQYLVQAFLMHNAAYRVRFASVMLNHYRKELLEQLFPAPTIAGASSVWIEKME